MAAFIKSRYRIGLPALLMAYAVLSAWLGWTETVNGVIEQVRLQDAAAKDRPPPLPSPTIVFR
jgi:hypothetical protein